MIGRRDLIKIAAGGTVGTALTPLPWKLLDDTAIWSQNWSWIPKVPRGEVVLKESTCTLCPAGCGVKAQCVAGRAVTLEPAAGAALCPSGLGAHAAAYHPRRLRQRTAVPQRIADALKNGPVAILDLGPRRAMSSIYGDLAKSHNGQYLRIPDRDEAFLNALAARIGREPGTLGVDLEHTRTLISFGAPVLETWATPGRVMERWSTGELNIIQIEPRQSRTALAANRWIPALFTPEDFTAAGQPAVAVGHVEPEAVADLNLRLGAVGREGGIVARNPLPWAEPPARDWFSVPDGSVQVLVIDASRAYEVMPWPLIRRKLADSAIVVAFAYKEDSITAHADWTFPVSAPFETIEDVTTPPCAAVPSYAVAPALIPAEVKETPVEHLNAMLGTSLPSVEEVIKQRIAATKQGEALTWVDNSPRPVLRVTAKASAAAVSSKELPRLALLVNTRRASGVTPFETKLDQESGLYTPPSIARLNPDTARSIGLENGVSAVIETGRGSVTRQVLIDPAVMPGIVEVAASPAAAEIADICAGGESGDWRLTAVNVRRS